ncbi:MAG: hypothetical protein ACRDH6_01970 [Actinomycetota bacterium]
MLAGLRDDQEGYRALLPAAEEHPEFLAAAFSTIALLAHDVGQLMTRSAEEVLQNIAQSGQVPIARDVAQMALAGERNEFDVFDDIGGRISHDPEFVPAIFGLVVALAKEAGARTGTSAKAVLEDLATTAAIGESGLLGEEPEQD